MYLPVVGLEIHLQVKTNSKMFCRCSSQYFESEPNSHVCPVCFGLPGAIPVPNKVAFNKALKLAVALNCTINQETKFDRKNYFYPDLPKGYQISQYDQPIGEEGYLEIEYKGDSRRVRIIRVHLEEDTGKSLHAENDETLLDYNKSGVPLLEVVTYPDFESTEEVILFAKRLRQIVRYLNVSDAEMQKGQMRYELNISVKPDTMPLGQLPDYKAEVKNIGSISVLEKVLNFEVARQIELHNKGEKIPSQTRGLKGMTGETVFQRSKETADDYRYFPEPDIPPLTISNELINSIKESMPELPHQRKQRYVDLGLEFEQADIFVEDTERGDWYDGLLKIIDSENNADEEYIFEENAFNGSVASSRFPSKKYLAKEAAKWIVGDISGLLEKKGMTISNLPLSSIELIRLLGHIQAKQLSGSNVKKILEMKFDVSDDVSKIIADNNMLQKNDIGVVESFVRQVIEENPRVVLDIEKNPNAIKFLVGQVMRLSKGTVNPKVAEAEIRKSLVL